MKLFFISIIFSVSLITRLTAANYYWVGGSGDWSDIGHWVTTSGGTVNYMLIPTFLDDVYFDSNSFSGENQIVTVNVSNPICKSMNWTGALHTPTITGSNDLRIYGSLTLISGIKWNITGQVIFEATTPGQTITSSDHTFLNSIVFNGAGGGWTFQDAISTGNTLFLINGSLNTNDMPVSCRRFNSDNTNVRALQLGASIVNITNTRNIGDQTFNFNGDNCAFNAGTSKILLSQTGKGDNFINGANSVKFYEIELKGSGLCDTTFKFSIVAPAIINKLNLSGTGLLVKGLSDLQIDSLVVNDECKKFLSNTGVSRISTILCNANSDFIINSDDNDDIGHTIFNGSLGTINGAEAHFRQVDFLSDGNIYGNNTFDILTFSTDKIYTLQSGAIQTINNSLIANGSCTDQITLQSSKKGTQAIINKTSGNITINGIIMQDMNATGGAVFTANNSVNIGNNSGWIINTAVGKNLYWVGGTGNWNDLTHWSTVSGGAGGSCIPTFADDVYFDAKSFLSSNQTVTVNVSNPMCRNMNWTDALYIPTIMGKSDLRIYGSLMLIKNMSWNITGQVIFEATTAGQTITSSGSIFLNNLVFQGIGGEWALQDNLITNNTLLLINGSLNTNNKTVNCRRFISDNTNIRSLQLGTSTVNIINNVYTNEQAINFNTNNCVLSAGASKIGISKYGRGNNYITGDNPINFNEIEFRNIYPGYGEIVNLSFSAPAIVNKLRLSGSNVIVNGMSDLQIDSLIVNNACEKAFSNSGISRISTILCNANTNFVINTDANDDIVHVVFNGDIGTINGTDAHLRKVDFLSPGNINGNNTFDTLTFSAGKMYKLQTGAIQTINGLLIANGSCTDQISIQSAIRGTRSTIKKASGNITINGAILEDMIATGGALFTANSSVDMGNNTGWVINSAKDISLYWVGGTGNWNDARHWSYTSGGLGGACVPTLHDDVYFDSKSFSRTNQMVTVNVSNPMCRSMSWTGALYSPTISGSNDFRIFGSLTLIPSMSWKIAGHILFEATTTGQTITSAWQTFSNNVVFNGVGGGWTLLDRLTTSNTLVLVNGSLNTNNNNVNCSRFISDNTNNRAVQLGTTIISIVNSAFPSVPTFSFNGDNCNWDAGASKIFICQNGRGVNNILGSNPINFNEIELNSFYPGCDSMVKLSIVAPTIIKNLRLSGNAVMVNGLSNLQIDGLIVKDACKKTLVNSGTSKINTILCNTSSEFILNADANDDIGHIIFNGALGTINGTDARFRRVDFLSDGNINGNSAFDSLTFSAGKTFTLQSGAIETINSLFQADGNCANLITIKSSKTGIQTSIYKTSGDVTISRSVLQGIKATGGASFTANNSMDIGNNSGWTINNAVGMNLYWVGGTGNWEDPKHWATTSGGAGGTCIPSFMDDVYFDSNSFKSGNNMVIINITNPMCRNMTWTGALYNPAIKGNTDSDIHIYGSLTLVTGMFWHLNGQVIFEATTIGQTISSAGHSFLNNVVFRGAGGGWTLQDRLTTSNTLFLVNGSLATNNMTVNCTRFISDNANVRELQLGTSVINIVNTRFPNDQTFNFNSDNCILNASDSKIIISQSGWGKNFIRGNNPVAFNVIELQNRYPTCDSMLNLSINAPVIINKLTLSGKACLVNGLSGLQIDSLIVNDACQKTMFNTGASKINTILCNTNTKFSIHADANDDIGYIKFNGSLGTIYGTDARFGKVEFLSNGNINGNNTFDTLSFSADKIYTLQSGAIQTITDSLLCRGNGCFPITLKASTFGVQSTIYKASGAVSADYVEMQDQNAAGRATFYAGDYSSNLKNNTGWKFNNAIGYSYGLGRDTCYCSGRDIVLNTNNFNGGIDFLWQDGSKKPTLRINKSGKYSVRVNYGGGCSIQDTIKIDILETPTVITSCIDTTVCVGDNITLFANGGTTWQWSGPNGYTSTDQNPVIVGVSPLHSGFYSVKATSNNCTSEPDTTEVIINFPTSPVKIHIEPSVNPICKGERIIFKATSSNGGSNPQYQWEQNGINVGRNSSIYMTDSLANNDQIRCILTSNSSCAASPTATSIPVNVTVNNNPVSVIIIPNDDTICLGSNVILTAIPENEGTDPSYLWSVNGTVIVTNTPIYEYPAKNGDIIFCILHSNISCSTGNPGTSNAVKMFVLPNVPVSNTITVNQNMACEGVPVTYTALPINGGTEPFYQWKVNGNPRGTNSATFDYPPTGEDIVNCLVTSNIRCTTNNPAEATGIKLKVEPKQMVSVSIAAHPGTEIVKGRDVIFTAFPVSGGNNPTFQWQINGDSVGTNNFTYSSASLRNGDRITCTLTPDRTCVADNSVLFDELTMIVDTLHLKIVMQVPNAFIPGIYGPSEGWYEQGDRNNQIFRPVIKYNLQEQYHMFIYNRWGNLIFETDDFYKGWDGYFNGKLCPQGAYVWKIKYLDNDGQTIVKTGTVTLIQQ